MAGTRMGYLTRLDTWPSDLDDRAASDVRGEGHQRRISDSRHKAEVAATRAEVALKEMRLLVREQVGFIWSRSCWICGAKSRCRHREQELADLWQK